MAQAIGSVRAEMSAGWAQFRSDMGKARKAVEDNATGMQRAMARAKKGFNATVKAIKVMSVAAVGVGLIVGRMVKQQIEAADQARKTAQAVGITTEAFTGLTWAAGQSGVQTDKLTGALARLNATLGEAAIGTLQQEGILKALGIEIRNVEGQMKSADVVLSEIADRFADMPDGVDKSAAAIKIFGRSGAALIPLLNSGSAGIKKLTDEAKSLGLVISDEQARQSEQFNDTIAVLGAVSRGTANQIAGELLPTLQDFADLLVDISTDGTLVAGVVDVMSWSFKRIATTAIGAAAAFHIVGKAMGGLAAVADSAVSDYRPSGNLFKDIFNLFKKPIENWTDTKQQADIVIDDIEATFLEYAERINKIMSMGAGDKPEGDEGRERIKRMADMLKTLREELTKTTTAAKEIAKPELDWMTQLSRGLLDLPDVEFPLDSREYDKWKDLYDERKRLHSDMTENIKRLTLSEVDYEEWAYQKRLQFWKNSGVANKQFLDTMAEEHRLKMDELTTVTEKTFGDDLVAAMEGWASNWSGTLNDMLWGAETTFEDIVQSFGKMLTQMIIQKQIVEPLFSGGSSVIGKLFGNAQGNAFVNGQVQAFGKGAVVSRPTIFPMAHGVGLMGEAGPEGILPLKRTAKGDLGVNATGVGKMEVHIHNNAGANVQAKEGYANGQPRLDIMIDNIMSEKLLTGKSGKTLRSSYNLSPSLISR